MLHHVSLPVSDIAASTRLYDAAMGALGYRRVCTAEGFVGYGLHDDEDQLALMQTSDPGVARPRFHLALAAPTQAAVVAFHEAALLHGATDDGAPGLRPHYGDHYYAAFIIDLDGNRIEAVHNEAAASLVGQASGAVSPNSSHGR